MSDPKEISFDILQAKELSHKLFQKREITIQDKVTVNQPDYIRFKITPPSRARQAPAPVVEKEERRVPEIPAGGFDGIESLLKWCHEVSKADIAFVVDAEGFVLSSCGMSSEERSEGMGAELSYALEQLDRISDEETDLLSLCLEYNTKHIYGFATGGDPRQRFILGLSTKTAIENNVKEVLTKVTSMIITMIS